MRIGLSLRQRDLVLREVRAPEHLMKLVRVAPVEGVYYQIRLTMEQLEELLDCIEYRERETKSKKLQTELYDLCEFMEQFGLKKIVDMESFRHDKGAYEEAREYPEDVIGEHSPQEDPSLGVTKRLPSSADHLPPPDEFNELFLKSVEHQGRMPRSEMGGLSWDQLIKLFKSDWADGRGLMSFNKSLKLKDLQKAVTLHRARTLLGQVVQSNGVKATVAGNLNRKFVGLMVDCLSWPDDHVQNLHKMNKVINEQDVFPLHIVRIMLDLSGLLTLKKGRFSATKKGEYVLSEDKAGMLFHLLFETLFQRMNLAYLDRMASIPIFQDTIAYSLFMLSREDMGWKRNDYLASELLVPPVKWEMENAKCEPHWFLDSRLLSPLEDFGLLQRRELPKQSAPPGIREVRKTPLFDRFISFHVD